MAGKKFGYRVEFVEDLFGSSPVLADVLKEATGSENPRALLVADINVVQRMAGLGTKIGRYVNEHGIQLAGSPIVLVGGEKIKADNLQSALKIMSAMLDAKLSSSDCVVVLGGGTLLDVAGYAAAQVRGGVNLVRVPTTPAAMMDAAFASYAALDSLNVKDALRVPSVPKAVLIDFGFAMTVLDGVWRGGIGEAVRIAAALDSALLKKMEMLAPAYCERQPEALSEAVKGTVAVRMKKGATDFASWSAARLESMSGYKLPHGYSIPTGICIDVGYAVEKGLMKQKDADFVVEILKTCGALDGVSHSYHVLSQVENILLGLDAWRLSHPDGIVVPCGLGKSTVVAEPDREAYQKVLKTFVPVAKAN